MFQCLAFPMLLRSMKFASHNCNKISDEGEGVRACISQAPVEGGYDSPISKGSAESRHVQIHQKLTQT